MSRQSLLEFRINSIFIVTFAFVTLDGTYSCRIKFFTIIGKSMSNYLDELNDSQREAVLYNDGPSLVIAGAGSGKTRVLTYKIAYLLDQGYEPSSILALTFTNKAAREMKERIARQVGEKARYLWMGTFHSIFARILRTESQALGFNSKYTIYDAADSKSMIKTIIKDLQLDEKVYKPSTIQSRISLAKNFLIFPNDYDMDREMLKVDQENNIPLLHQIYRLYVERCKQSNAMDFDDLLVNTYLLFKNFPEIRQHYAEHFKYVLVDEYQDTNFAQHRIVQLLTEERQHVCVVGDDAQSIYSFRGANIDNILKFTKMYPNTKLFKLEQNYRSTQTIVGAANSLIAKNARQIHKDVYSRKEKGEALQVFSAYSDTEEGSIVVNQIKHLHVREDCSYADIAVLYRTNAQSRIFEELLRKHSIPYKIYGGLSFYQRKEIKDIISYFRLAVNPDDEEAFKRIINYPARGIGDTTLMKLVAASSAHHVSLWEVLSNPESYDVSAHKGTLTKLKGFYDLVAVFQKLALEKDAYEVGVEIVRCAHIMDELNQSRDPEDMSRKENIEELMNGLNDFVQERMEEGNRNIFLTDYLAEISLLTDQDNEKEQDVEKVTLMTIHSAKGLEFRNVFVVGLEENLFPSAMSMNTEKELEEERRLFYVAITRAEEHCYLSYAKMRYRYGQMEFSRPSRFLKDIDPCYLDIPQDEPIRKERREEETMRSRSGRPVFVSERPKVIPRPVVTPVHRTLKKVSSVVSRPSAGIHPPTSVRVGDVIEHERFGLGEVLKIEGTGDNCKATVKFRNAGEKQLLLKFARFKVVS